MKRSKTVLLAPVHVVRWRSLAIAATAATGLLAVVGTASAGRDNMTGRKPDRHAIAAAQSPGHDRAVPAESRHAWRGDVAADVIARFARRELSIPWGVTPLLDTSGINCSINQGGDVWFIGGSMEPVYSRTCTVPFGKAIVAPVVYYVNDFPCPDPQFAPAAGQSLEAFLRAGAADMVAGVTLTEARLDGKPVAVKHVVTPVFGFTGAADLTANYDWCITGAPQLAVTDGYFAFVEPPTRGTHVLHIRSVGPYGESLGTVTLKIQ